MSTASRGLRALVPSLISLGVAIPVTPAIAADVIVAADRESLTAQDLAADRAEADRQPGGATVVAADDYRRGRATTWADMLGDAPGVYVQPRFGSEEARIAIRGSGLQRTFHGRGLLALADGIPLNLADGGFDMQAVDPALLDHIAVYRGANGHAFGAATLGGAIDFVSPTGRTASPFDARVEGGSFGYLRTTVSGGAASGAWDGWVGASAAEAGGYREHSQSQSQRAQGNLGWRFADEAENRVYVGYSDSVMELPGALTRRQLEDDPRQVTAASLSGDQHRDYPLLRVGDRLAWLAGPSQVTLGVAYSRKDLVHPIFQVIDQRSDDGVASLRWTWEGERYRLSLLGVGWAGLVHARQFINVAGEKGALTADGYQRSAEGVADLADEYAVASATWLSAGAQFARATRTFDDHFVTPTDGDQSDAFAWNGCSPRMGIRQGVGGTAQAFANVSRSFEPPSFGEIVTVSPAAPGLLALAAQRAWTAEIGSRGTAERVSWDASLYYAWLRDELIGYQIAPNVSCTVNADRTRHAGAELGGDAVALDGLPADGRIRVRLSYLFSWFRFTDDPQFGNGAIAGVPPHALRAGIDWEAGGWYAGPTAAAASDAVIDHANTTRAPGWTTVGVRAGYRTAGGFSAWVEGRNLLDKTYAATFNPVTVASAASAVYYPGDGCAFYAGAGWRW